MRKMRLIFIGMALVLAACSKSEDKKSEDLSYTLTENGCETKTHSFSNATDYCKALQDDKVNNGCALQMRKDLFKTRCTGEFTPPVEPPAPTPTPANPNPGTNPNPDPGQGSTTPPASDFDPHSLDVTISVMGERNGVDCDKAVFSSSIKELQPRLAITGLEFDSKELDVNGNYLLKVNTTVDSMVKLTALKIYGNDLGIGAFSGALQRPQKPEIKLTESKQCKQLNPDLILVDLVTTGAPPQARTSVKIESWKPEGSACVVESSNTLSELIKKAYPAVNDSDSRYIMAEVTTSTRIETTGELFQNEITLNFYDNEAKLQKLWAFKFNPDLTRSLIRSLGSGDPEAKIKVTTHQECVTSQPDSPILITL